MTAALFLAVAFLGWSIHKLMTCPLTPDGQDLPTTPPGQGC